jgi:hypothetical protein
MFQFIYSQKHFILLIFNYCFLFGQEKVVCNGFKESRIEMNAENSGTAQRYNRKKSFDSKLKVKIDSSFKIRKL